MTSAACRTTAVPASALVPRTRQGRPPSPPRPLCPVRVAAEEADRLHQFCADHETHGGNSCLAGFVIQVGERESIQGTIDALPSPAAFDQLQRVVSVCLGPESVVVRDVGGRLVAVTQVADLESAEQIAKEILTGAPSRRITRESHEARILVTVGGSVVVGWSRRSQHGLVESLLRTASEALEKTRANAAAHFQIDRLLVQSDAAWNGTRVPHPNA